jgi:hypothetical protein
MKRILVCLPVGLALHTGAHAYVFIGNPKASLTIERDEGDLIDGSALIDTVRVHACGGGYTDVTVDTWIDPVAGWQFTLPSGDLCGVSVRWGDDVLLDAPTFTLRYEQLATHVPFTSSTGGEVVLSPLTVDSGTWTGAAPRLVISVP